MILIFSFQTQEEKEKFEYIYETYKKLLLHKAYGILKDLSLAEDAVSEAYIRIYKNLHKIEDPTSGQTISFAATIVKNVSLTMLEKEKKQAENTLDLDYRDSFDLESHVLAEMTTQQIYDSMEALGDELKTLLLLKFAHNYSHKEIADIMKLSENNVTVKLHRAKKKLIGILREEGIGFEK